MALCQRRYVGVGHIEVVEAVGHRDDVDDGVDGANLVEVNLLEGQAMSLGLGLGDDVENAVRDLLCARRKVGGVDDGGDVRR